MNLTLPQIRVLFAGMSEIVDIQKKSSENAVNEKKIGKDKKEQPKVNDLGTLLSSLGGSVKMSDKAKNALKKIANKKS